MLINSKHNLRQKQPIDYNNLNAASTADVPNYSLLPKCLSTPLQQAATATVAPVRKSAAQLNVGNASLSQGNGAPVINSDNHYERQYTCKRCGFFTNNPRAVLYHRKEFHFEKINVHECIYCQYASQYSGKVERHTLLRHKIDINNTRKSIIINFNCSVYFVHVLCGVDSRYLSYMIQFRNKK